MAANTSAPVIPGLAIVENHTHTSSSPDLTRKHHHLVTSASDKTDVFSRASTSSTSGRGSLAGWTACPLCPSKSGKRYALGRGIAAHLHAVHTPWNLGKAERRRREASRRRKENERRKRTHDGEQVACQEKVEERLDGWEPTTEEVEAWGAKVLELTAQVEAGSGCCDDGGNGMERPPKRQKAEPVATRVGKVIGAGHDRTGHKTNSYRDSLPPFVRAAADGDADALKRMVGDCSTGSSSSEATEGSNRAARDESEEIARLLDVRDRNGSTAEHWAAGGGHLECLELLMGWREHTSPGGHLRGSFSTQKRDDDNGGEEKVAKNVSSCIHKKKKLRRRDGKTSLHYAARNGHNSCIDYLLLHSSPTALDEPSGDGTTPLHLACYGGHFSTVEHLISLGASVDVVNDWGCGVAHWVAMSINKDSTEVLKICNFLKWECSGVDFHTSQRQGHTPLHKAAQRLNRHVIEWLARRKEDSGAGLTGEESLHAGRVDEGGNKPSEIWLKVGGEEGFARWMRDECCW